MLNIRTRLAALLPLGIAFAMTSGCGGNPVGKIRGEVSLNGSPLQYGQVTAYNEKGEAVARATVTDGKYELIDVPLGKVTLAVQTHSPDGQPITAVKAPLKEGQKAPPAPKAEVKAEMKDKGPQLPEKIDPVPLKYTNAKQSGLSVDAVKGETKYDIAMTGKGEVPHVEVIKPGGPGGPSGPGPGGPKGGPPFGPGGPKGGPPGGPPIPPG
jgi:hypothetical protein